MSHHHYNEQDKLHYYEGDQSKLYSGVLAHHEAIDSPESKAKIRKIVMVTLILTAITILEVSVGLGIYHADPDVSKMGTFLAIVTFFVTFTLVKAYFIVKVFMHMGDETKMFQKFILTPLILVIWLIVVLLIDAIFHLRITETFGFNIHSILGNHLP